ncbi:hypothetical protein FS837_012488 [Tulasnella sp. UAMH 9824]|nr:hypothetical protein FS837_012488 [Tulasnella sp. UAMH 9824]
MVHTKSTELPAYKLVNARNLQMVHDQALRELHVTHSGQQFQANQHVPTSIATSGSQNLQERITIPDSLMGTPVSRSESDSMHRPNAELYDRHGKESDCWIRFDHHPASKQASQTFSSYEESIQGNPWSGDRESELPAKPYAPFSTFADFDFAEFVTEHRLSSSTINDLLKRLHRTWASQVLVTLETADEIEQHVKMSIEPKLAFNETRVSSSYQGAGGDPVHEEHVVFIRSIRDWVSAVVKDPVLLPHFQWYPVKKYHIVGNREVQYVDEPWSGQDWWDDQDAIGDDGILYDVEEEKSSPEYINYKRQLYHEVLLSVFSSIVDSSRVGHGVICADAVLRTLYILIKFASGDYEEQVDMALIRGVNSLHPCPVCLVPRNALSDITTRYPSRTAEQSWKAYQEAFASQAAGENSKAEEVLKAYSLRPVFNAFWHLNHTDPHRAMCFDILHFFDGGLWGRHLWPELIRCIREESGGANITVIDDRFSLLPSWQNMDHLEKVVDLTFVDSRTHFSIMKDMLSGPRLHVHYVVRSLAELRMYAGLHVVTPTRLAMARKARDSFAIMVNDLSGSVLKDFNFPKMHYLSHLLDHLWRKCASRHYNTILGEGMHVLMKAAFRQTNAKEFEAQIASQFDSLTAIRRIRRTVDLYEQALGIDRISPPKRSEPNNSPHLEAPDNPIPVHAFENNSRYNLNSFHLQLCHFLASLAAEGSASSAGAQASLDSLMIFPFKRLRVPYISYDDWSANVDHVHAHPFFHGKPRYDAILLSDKATGKLGFARLKFLFRCYGLGRAWDIAVISRARIIRQASEVEIGMAIVEESEEEELILTSSIKRAVFLSPTFENIGEVGPRFFVNDLVDYDMILRLNPSYIYGT